MSKPRSPFQPLEFIRAYSAPAVCLLLWLGVCAIAWTSLSNLGAKRPSRAPSQAAATADPLHNNPAESLIQAASAATGGNGDSDLGGQTGSGSSVSSLKDAQLEDPPDAILSVSRAKPEAKPAANDTTAAPAPSSTDKKDGTPGRQQATAVHTRDTSQAKPEPAAKSPDRKPTSSQASGQPSSDAKPAELTASEHISRAQLASEVENKEPVDKITGVFHSENKQLRRLYFFTEITGLRGHTVTHNWWHGGRVIAKVRSRVRGYSWRMYSSKKLIPSMAGPWRVVVTDDQGRTLSVAKFVYEVP